VSQAEAEWWYIWGFAENDNVAFSHAAFRQENCWRVHQTIFDFRTKIRLARTSSSVDGMKGPLFEAIPTERDKWVVQRVPRAEGRSYYVSPFAKAIVTFLGPKTDIYEVWHEHEFGPINLENGWDWMALKKGDSAWLKYWVGGECLSYGFHRDGPRTSPVEFPDYPFETSSDKDVHDPILGITYKEHPIRAAGFIGFVEFVQPKSIGRSVAVVDAKLKEYALGEPHATALLLALYQASQLADDIADCDERPDRIADVMRVLGVEMPRNPFFRAHADVLTATLAQVIDCWEWSNEHEDDPDKTRQVLAYSMKDAAIMYIRQVAFLVGGHEHAKRVLDDAIQFFHGPGGVEPFEVTR